MLISGGFATLQRQCWLFAIGSWFFAVAGWMQYALAPRGVQWWSAAIQFAGTILFNVSTGAAVWAHAVLAERRYVWAPDATGSLAFLISGALVVLAVGLWAPDSIDWRATGST